MLLVCLLFVLHISALTSLLGRRGCYGRTGLTVGEQVRGTLRGFTSKVAKSLRQHQRKALDGSEYYYVAKLATLDC